ncbi:MAG: hypothetical protein MI743_11090 [Sneathiellales bacterium]|nr:hypothetical protein [Sneathiellales bacterium]
MTWVVSIALAVILVLLGIWFLQKFYAKATLNSALVRTGLGGKHVVLSGGCLSLPIIHQTQRVVMAAVSFSSVRAGQDALLTGDELRADVAMEFEFRVSPTAENVAIAAQSLGSKIARDGTAIEEVLKGPLIDAMQTAASCRTLDEMHHDRASFTQEIETAVAAKAEKFGLSLISASLLSVDQSDVSQFDEKNAFDAKGMRRHAELVSQQRRERVQIETETALAIRQSALEKHQRQLEMERTEREATLAQEEALDRLAADIQAKTEEARSRADIKSKTARIDAEQKVQAAQIENDETLRRSEMAAIRALEETKLENEARLSRLRTAEFETQAAEEAARAQVLLAAEDVQAQKERATVAREHETARLRLEKDVALSMAQAKSEAETLATKTLAEAKAAKTLADAELAKAEARAAGHAAQIDAENSMSEALIRLRLEERKLDRLPEIMTQMMKPVEKIDSIKINQIGGLGAGGVMENGRSGTEGGGAEGAFGAAMDQILGMAVRLPAMKQMGEEIGLDFDANLAGRTADYANRIKNKEDKK